MAPIPTLEVLLVSEALPESAENDRARYLAQRTQQGAGNVQESARSQLPTLSNSPLDSPGELEGASVQDPFAGPSGGEAEQLVSALDARGARYIAEAESPSAETAETPQQLLAGAETTLPSSEDDPSLRLKGPQRRELMVSPSTRESAATLYIDSWRRRVERVGTLNFPNQARRRGLTGNPVIEVALASDGQLADIRCGAAAATRTSTRRHCRSCACRRRSSLSRGSWRHVTTCSVSPTSGSSRAGS